MASTKYLRRSAGGQTDVVGEPPRLGGELDDVLPAVGIDDIASQTALGHECRVLRHVACTLQTLVRIEASGHELRSDEIELLRAERCPGLQVRSQNAEGGRAFFHSCDRHRLWSTSAFFPMNAAEASPASSIARMSAVPQPPVECERDSHEVLEKVFDGECAVRQCDGSQDLASRMDRNGQVRRAFRR